MDMLRILHLEDSPLDAELIHSRIRRGELACTIERVDTREAFIQALRNNHYDLVLADYVLPDFNGVAALNMTREQFPDLPFIFVSGVLGEEVAIDTLKRGATDYVVKQRSERLVPTILRAMAEAEERRQRRLAEERQRRALREADAANRAKDEFLAVLSHELRTPLSPVLTTVSLLELDPAVPAFVRDHLAVIRRNIELEARLIDDLLDITRITRGKIQLDRQAVDVHDVVRHVIEICQSDADQRHQRIALSLEASATQLYADPARLHQILWNLLKNAIKFTPERGSISVGTRNRGDYVIIEVEDSGIGISSDQIDRIFNAFEQADSNGGERRGGLGLGLAIAQALARGHGGLISAYSAGPGQGTRFAVTLPIAKGPHDNVRPEADSQTVSGSSRRILLVEDHVDTARAMSGLLNRMGHGVDIAHSVESARRLLGTNRYDVLISDIGLPDGSGMDLVQSIPPEQKPHAIALTGYGMEKDIERCLASGFDKHLVKPVSRAQLQAAIGGK